MKVSHLMAVIEHVQALQKTLDECETKVRNAPNPEVASQMFSRALGVEQELNAFLAQEIEGATPYL